MLIDINRLDKLLRGSKVSPEQKTALATWLPDFIHPDGQLPNLRLMYRNSNRNRNAAPTDSHITQNHELVGHIEDEGHYWHAIGVGHKPDATFEVYRPRFELAANLQPAQHARWAHYWIHLWLHDHMGHGGLVVELVNTYPHQVNYFEWGKCVHTYEEKTPYNCYHVLTCTKCGHRYSYDSGD